MTVGEDTQRAESENALQPRHVSFLYPSAHAGKWRVPLNAAAPDRNAPIVQKDRPDDHSACVSFAPDSLTSQNATCFGSGETAAAKSRMFPQSNCLTFHCYLIAMRK